MTIRTEDTIKAVEHYAESIQRKWKKRIVPLRGWDACKFFIWVMLDQLMVADRARAGAQDFVNRRYDFCPPQATPKTFWKHVTKIHLNNKNIFKFTDENEKGHSGAYAGRNINKFPAWLRNNANMIIEDYGSIVENIWEKGLSDDNEKKIEELHERFEGFAGIGPNLANMAVFSLVRDHGYAGGWESRKYLRIKFDTHVRQVVSRAFLGTSQADDAEAYVKELNSKVQSPADFDFALFTIGQKYCYRDNPDCTKCPIHESCVYYNSEEEIYP